MKIGIIKETKTPPDSRVAFTPEQLVHIKEKFNCEVIVQKSNIRAIPDDEYAKAGVKLADNVADCDYLFGIKEVALDALIPNKHYFFFGHIAKLQEYNKPLLKKMMELGITFTDYEYLVDEKQQRLVAFGWWAGAVGVYNTFRAWGLRHNTFSLPKPHLGTTLSHIIEDLKNIELPKIKILVTGNGRVSQGAQFVLNNTGVKKISKSAFLNEDSTQACYTVADVDTLVKNKTNSSDFDFEHFKNNPDLYESDFMKFAIKTDMLLSCHFWGAGNPVYLSKTDLQQPDRKIKVIGDVTCDIMGSIHSTLRASTHDEPFYDFNPVTGKEEKPFSKDKNITVMAVDTLPNALPTDTSKAFGEQLIESIIPELFKSSESAILKNATILKQGKITDKFAYLKSFAAE